MATSGAIASLSYNGTAVVGVGTASFSLQRAAYDATGIGALDGVFVTGYQTGTATADLFFDLDETTNKALVDDCNTGAAAKALLLTLESGESISGSAFVTGFDVTASSGSVTRATISFQLTGAITVTHT
jgi:glycerate-2-kinase